MGYWGATACQWGLPGQPRFTRVQTYPVQQLVSELLLGPPRSLTQNIVNETQSLTLGFKNPAVIPRRMHRISSGFMAPVLGPDEQTGPPLMAFLKK